MVHFRICGAIGGTNPTTSTDLALLHVEVRVGVNTLYLHSRVGLEQEHPNHPSPGMEAPRRPRASSAATNSYLRLIASGDLTSPQVITTTLTNALGATDYSDCVENLSHIGIKPQSFIDGLDKVGLRLFLLLATLIHDWLNLRRSISFHRGPISTSDVFER